mmetsp:Transcript_16863/g.42882  ORF Transcript_16863/g.42882 Transcript_16863/m.42882 type:complete len:91 (-) Transcript_16863:2-274(-)
MQPGVCRGVLRSFLSHSLIFLRSASALRVVFAPIAVTVRVDVRPTLGSGLVSWRKQWAGDPFEAGDLKLERYEAHFKRLTLAAHRACECV